MIGSQGWLPACNKSKGKVWPLVEGSGFKVVYYLYCALGNSQIIVEVVSTYFELGNTNLNTQEIQRQPGHLWMVKGPCEFCPSVEMDIITRRKAIPLDENEGMYVRDMKSGKVRFTLLKCEILLYLQRSV